MQGRVARQAAVERHPSFPRVAFERVHLLGNHVHHAVAVVVGAAWGVPALVGARPGEETVVAAPDGQIGNPNVLRDPAAVAGLRTAEDEGPSGDLRALVDWQTGERAPVWRSALAVLPLELRLRTRQVAPPVAGAPPAGPPMVARKDKAVDLPNFYPGLVDDFRHKGLAHGLPFNSGPTVTFFNHSLLTTCTARWTPARPRPPLWD